MYLGQTEHVCYVAAALVTNCMLSYSVRLCKAWEMICPHCFKMFIECGVAWGNRTCFSCPSLFRVL